MNLIWETSLKIRAFDVDANNRLKVSTIFDYFQDAASNDAERRNFGYQVFIPMSLYWVLSWMKIECIEFPKFSDEVKIQTWGKKQHKLYSMRDYLLINPKSEIICKGTSAWLLLDSKTLRPKILPELFPNIKMLDSKDAITDLPQKIKPYKENEIIYSSQIRYSDIDLNQHTNNAKYIELMLNCYDEEFHKNHILKTLTVSFNSQTKYNDQIQLRKGMGDSNSLTHFIEAKNINSEKIVFQASLEWS
jgi:acyl-ACP thioesterase